MRDCLLARGVWEHACDRFRQRQSFKSDSVHSSSFVMCLHLCENQRSEDTVRTINATRKILMLNAKDN